MRGVMLVMGIMLPLCVDEEDDDDEEEDVVVRPSLISIVRKVFMSGSSSPSGTCVSAALPGVRSSSGSAEVGISFSSLVPPREPCDWPVEDRGLSATPMRG